MSTPSYLSEPEEVLAKSGLLEQSVATHTKEALRWWRNAVEWHAPMINYLAQSIPIDKTALTIRLFLTVAFHDVGKGNIAFQQKIRKEKYTEPESHALFGLPVIAAVVKEQPLLEKDTHKFFPELLAIATHHSALTKEVFGRFEGVHAEYVGMDYFKHFFETVNQEGESFFGTDWRSISFDPECLNTGTPFELFSKIRLESNYFINNPDHKRPQKVLFREMIILFNSVLHTSDWLASSGAAPDSFYYAPAIDTHTFTQSFAKRQAAFSGWRPFQEKMAQSSSHLIVQIPTGQGKTEGSLLWALGRPMQKILFLLPTQVTVNKIYQRLDELFEDRDIGLAHGNARFIINAESPLETSLARIKLMYSRSFFYPITAGTVDQFIYSFFNWGKWSLTGSASLQSNIIIDEIHLYDAFTLGLILMAIKQAARLGAKFCIMSATMPVFLEEHLKGILEPCGGVAFIRDPQMLDLQRHVVYTDNRSIEELVTKIKQDFDLGKKVLIVVNTKAKARELYDLFNEQAGQEYLMLYHSQFIVKDRKYKEDHLETIGRTDYSGRFIAICTQVVEVSLDLDFDVLYTENAPIDAIIQRLGRANRKNKKPEKAKVTIAHHSEQSKKYIYKKADKILEKSWELLKEYTQRLDGNLKEKDFVEILQSVYTKDNMGSAYYEEFDQGTRFYFKTWEEVTHYMYTLSSDERQLNAVTSRISDYVQVDCILQKHFTMHGLYEAVSGEKKDFDRINKYLVKIPLWIAKKHRIAVDWDLDIPVVDFKYDFDTGITYEQDIESQIN